MLAKEVLKTSRGPSPSVSNKRKNFLLVDTPYGRHRFLCKRRKVGGATVVRHLFRSFAAGDGASDRIEHQNPAQGELAHRDACRQELSQLFNGFKAGVVIHSGKRFAHVK